MATVLRENIGLLNDKLTVQLQKEDYLPAFEKKLKEYSKTANIPGFRKGMVPAGMIKKMYGAGIYSDEVLRTIEKELYNYLNTEKPEIFAQPLPLQEEMSKLDMYNPAEVNFAFEIGLKPAFTLPNLATANLTQHKVAITEAMINEEVTLMQDKAGKKTEIEAITNKTDVIELLFTECDENAIDNENGIVKDITLDLKTFNQKMQQQLMDKKVGENFVFELASAFEGENATTILQELGLDNNEAATQKYFNAQVKKISTSEKAELGEPFFNEVFPNKGITTIEELNSALKTEMEGYWTAQSTNQLHDQLYHLLLNDTQMEFPSAFLTRWLTTADEKKRTPEEAAANFPDFEKQLKWTLISDTIIKENKLEVSEEDLRNSMKAEVSRYFGNMNMGEDMSWLESYIDRMMKDEKQVDATYRRLISQKVFDWAASQANPVEKIVTTEELQAMQHKH